MRRTQNSGFVEVFNCLIVLETNVGRNNCATVLKVPFEKAVPPPLPFLRSRTSGQNLVKICKSLSPDHFQVCDFNREFCIFNCTLLLFIALWKEVTSLLSKPVVLNLWYAYH